MNCLPLILPLSSLPTCFVLVIPDSLVISNTCTSLFRSIHDRIYAFTNLVEWFTVINHHSSIINHQSSIIIHHSSIINHTGISKCCIALIHGNGFHNSTTVTIHTTTRFLRNNIKWTVTHPIRNTKTSFSSYGFDGLYVLRIFMVPSREPRQRSWPVRSQHTEKILPRTFEWSWSWFWSSSTFPTSFFELESIESTQRFCSLLNVQIRTTHYSTLPTILSAWNQSWFQHSYSISHFAIQHPTSQLLRFL